MSYVFRCATDISPCPATDQQAITQASADDLAQLGLTAESVGLAITFGFGVVFFFAMAGMVAGWAIRLIRSI